MGMDPWLASSSSCWSCVGCATSRQARHAVLRNYPVIGHLRFLLEFIRPEIRQYFLESDNEATPFSRQQRSIVYQRAKGDPDKRPFGTQLDVVRDRLRVDQPLDAPTVLATHDFRVTIGAGRARSRTARASSTSRR